VSVKLITSCRQFDACLPITRQRKDIETPKLAGMLSLPRVTVHTRSKVKMLKVKKVRRRIKALG